ncbi:MAG: DUF3291 domain-containing protein [Alphaproteobacteria bacterium]|nr:DUF3291 domain-containing protein [Alphaproteobacteria bacterium]
MTDWHLAQINVARGRAPLDDPLMADFAAALDDVNALAEASDGFIWRLTDEGENDATSISAYDDPLVIINMSVWRDVDALAAFAYRNPGHMAVFRRRKDWFVPWQGPYLCMWWIPAGELPTVEDGKAALERLATEGPGPFAFTFKDRFDPPRMPLVDRAAS